MLEIITIILLILGIIFARSFTFTIIILLSITVLFYKAFFDHKFRFLDFIFWTGYRINYFNKIKFKNLGTNKIKSEKVKSYVKNHNRNKRKKSRLEPILKSRRRRRLLNSIFMPDVSDDDADICLKYLKYEDESDYFDELKYHQKKLKKMIYDNKYSGDNKVTFDIEQIRNQIGTDVEAIMIKEKYK